MGAQLQRQAREGRAGLAVIDPVEAVLLPDDRLHLGRGLGLRHPEVVVRDVDDRRSQRIVVRLGRLRRLLERHQPHRHA